MLFRSGRFSEPLLFPPEVNRSGPPLSSALKMDVKLSLDTRVLYDLDKREEDYTSALIAAQEAQRKLVVGVEKDYYSLVAAALDIDNSRRTLGLDEESYRQTRLRFERGLESELTLLNAELKLQGSQTGLINAQAGYDKKATAFKRILGLMAQDSLILSTPMVVAELDSSTLENGRLNELIEGISQRLDLEIKRRAIQSAEVAANRYHATNRLPLVTLGSSLAFSLSDFTVPLDGFTLSAGISFNADAWVPGSQKDLAYRALVEARDQQLVEYDRMLKSAREKVEDLLVDASLKINELRLTEAKLSLAERIYAQTINAYNSGSANLQSVNDAQNKVEIQRQALVSSQLSYLHLVIDVGYALGVDWRSLLGSANS